MATVKLNTRQFDRLRSKDMMAAMAAALGCSVAAVRMMRWRAGTVGYGTRSDGQARIRAANGWMKQQQGVKRGT